MMMKGNPMKKTRQLATAAGALALVTGVASLALLGGGSASAAGTPSSAFGLELNLAGTTAIDKLPSVVSTDGKLVEDELLDTDGLAPIASGGVVQVSAENGKASANVTGVGVGDGLLALLPTELTSQLEGVCNQLTTALDPVTGLLDNTVLGTLLDQVDDALASIGGATAGTPLDLSLLAALDLTNLTTNGLKGLCTVLGGQGGLVSLGTVIAKCDGTTGTTNVTDANVAGIPLNIPTEPNGKVAIGEGLSSLVDLTVNEQVNNADGTFTVNAVHLKLLGQIDLTVASATCGRVTTDGPSDPGPSDAPTPTPIKTNAPVTG